jgi:hypothetical protein
LDIRRVCTIFHHFLQTPTTRGIDMYDITAKSKAHNSEDQHLKVK